MLYYEKKLRKQGYNLIIGIDEAGRGPLAGPVVAGAVSLITYRFKNRINDSKRLTPLERQKAFFEIVEKSIFGIGIVDERLIDQLNIVKATGLAMKQAVLNLLSKIENLKDKRPYLIIDGNIKLDLELPYINVIKGDLRSKSVASASILAKVIRDQIMSLYDKIYPEYGFLKHKGYPTLMHKQRLKRFGPSLIHRLSFCHV